MAMTSNTCYFSPEDNFAYCKRCLTYIAFSDFMSAKVNPDDQSYDSFEKAMMM